MDESCGKENLKQIKSLTFQYKVWTVVSLAAAIGGVGITSSAEFRADPLGGIALYRPFLLGIFLTGSICFFGLLIMTVKAARLLHSNQWMPYKPAFFWITQFVLSFTFNGFGAAFIPLYLIVRLEAVIAKLTSRQA